MGMGGGSREGVNSEINVTPMADVMLVLLIIFMVVTPMLQTGFTVDLANTKNPRDMQEADRDDAIILAVTRDGRFFLGDERVTVEELGPRIGDLVSGRMDKTVYVKSDVRATYGDVVEIVDTVRNAGVDRIGLVTNRIDEEIRR